VKRSVRRTVTDLAQLAQTYLFNRNQKSALESKVNSDKAKLKKLVDGQGKVDPKTGNRNLYFDQPMTIGDKTYYGLQQRRIPGAEYMDEDEVRRFVGENLKKQDATRVIYKKVIEIVDADELFTLTQEGAITEDQVRALIRHHKPTYQLWPIESAPVEDEE
jgi:hypothetical protein